MVVTHDNHTCIYLLCMNIPNNCVCLLVDVLYSTKLWWIWQTISNPPKFYPPNVVSLIENYY